MNKIKVFVVDDSALMRKLISDMLNGEEDIEVIQTAINGKDLLNKLKNVKPDVITLDLEMPIMGGIETLKELKKSNIDTPVIVLSSITKEGTKSTMECLSLGAFDFIPKPSGGISFDVIKVKEQLTQKVRLASRNSHKIHNQVKPDVTVSRNMNTIKSNSKIEAVVIGASTGGPKALYKVITKFPEHMGVPVFVVQHMPVGFTKAFADRLNDNSKIYVKEAEDGEVYQKDTVYIAPGGYHMELGNGGRIKLTTEPAIWGVRPAVDKLFVSASKVFGAHLVSAVLTGMGRDGADGTSFIKDNGGITLSEDESTCVIYGMPKATFETGKVDIVAPIDSVADEILKITRGF